MRGSRRPSVVPITSPSFPTPPRPSVYRNIAYTFIGFTVVIVLAVVWLSSVHAEIVVKVKRETASLDTKVTVAKQTSPGQIPGRVVQGVFEKIQEFSVKAEATSTEPVATSSSMIPSPPSSTASPTASPSNESVLAKGTVRIVNHYAKSQTLVKTTRLLTSDGKLYRIDKQVVIPSGGEASVGVYADQVGAAFAIGPTKFTIPGLWIDLQKLIYAVSDQPFLAVSTKGLPPTPTPAPAPKTTRPSTNPSIKKSGNVVKPSDLEDAYRTLSATLLEQAKKQLTAELGDAKFNDAIFSTKIIEKKSNASVGQSTDTFLASVKLEVTMVAYAKEDMLALIRSKLKEKIPSGREILPFQADDVQYTVTSSDLKQETADVTISARGTYRLTTESPLLQKNIIAGKTKSEAEQILKAIDGVESVRVTISPGWMSKIPSLKDRIEMKVE